MTTYGSCSITEDGQKGAEKSEHSSHTLPISIHLSLVMLGLWRPWNVHKGASGYERTGVDGGEDTKIHKDTTAESILGERHPVEEDVVMETDYISEAEVWSSTKPKNNEPGRQRLDTTDFVFLTVLASLLVWYAIDMYYYIYATWGQKKFALDTMSYLCFISQTLSIVAYALFSRLSICLRILCRKALKVQAKPLEMEFIKSRVALIQHNCGSILSRRGCLMTQQFLLFLSLPLVNAVGKIVFDIVISPPRCQVALQHFNNTVASICFLGYGCFWYLVYVQRVSLHCQLNRALDKIRHLAFKRDIEGTRRLVDLVYSEFHVIRKFSGLWMAFTLFSVTVHVICCVVFSYQDSIHADAIASVESQESSEPWTEILLNLMLWTQNLMFFVVPYCAVGGANLEYMWHRFRHVLTKCKINDQLEFWTEVEIYVAQIDTLGTPALEWTLVYPFLGAMVSNALSQKNHVSLEYWSYRYDCDETHQNITDVLE